VAISQNWLDRFALLPGGYDPVKTAADGDYFDEANADKCIAFFAEYVTHIEGELAGEPFRLEPWQEAIVGCVFGWKRRDGLRRYREVFLYVPRKNGKSTLCGGVVNLVAFLDDEPGAQIYSAAAEREQASLVFRQTKGQILNKPELAEQVKIYATYKSIEYPGGVVFKALSADADTKHGFNTHLVIVDELHAHRNGELLNVLATSTGSRRQPLVWIITTADYDRPSICNEKYDYATKVRDGIVVDTTFLPVIYEAPRDADWTNPEVWKAANPNYAVSIKPEYLEREAKKAQAVAAYENTFRRLHLNQRTGQDVRLIAMDRWDAGDTEIDDEVLKRLPCWGGLDLGATSDFSAFVLVFAHDEGVYLKPYFWLPESPRKRDVRMEQQIQAWSTAGLVERTPGNVVDYSRILQRIVELGQQYSIKEIAADPWNAQQAMQRLQDEGFEVIEYRQGYASMAGPTKKLMDLIASAQLQHGGNPVLRWMASNAAGEMDAIGNLRLSKGKSTEKIDGLVAAVMGIGRLIAAGPLDRPGPHERGLRTL
jgi:phage terminase large subunit-like protein